MWNLKQMIFGERSVTKVAGLFASKPDAVAALQDLLKVTGFSAGQVRLLEPSDSVAVRTDAFERAIEPEEAGIWRTVIRAHVTMALIGTFVGFLIYGTLLLAGHPTIVSTPYLALVVFTSFGATFGLLIGGALAIRPDHGRLISLIRNGLQEGQWAVVAHPTSAEQTHIAMDVLMPGSVRVVRSL